MKNIKKIFVVLAFLAVPVFLFGYNAKPVFAADNSVAVQQEIQSLIRQIISLLQQITQLRLAQQNQMQQAPVQPQVQTQTQTSSGLQTATLTVKASGVTAYVSINNGSQFAYTTPITLNNGDTYSVTASASSGGSGNSTSKCSGVASSGGTYTCNITIN